MRRLDPVVPRGAPRGMRAYAARLVALSLGTLALASTAPAFAAPPKIDVEVSSRRVPADRPVRVTIVVEGDGAESAAVTSRPPRGELLSPLGSFSRSTSSRMVWAGGEVDARVSTKFSIDYAPEGTGAGRIPSFEVIVGPETYRTDPIDVEIVASGSASGAGGAAGGANSDARMLSRVSRDEIYIGEETVLEYVLQTRVRVTGFDPSRLEQLAGFIIEDEEIDPRATERSITGDDGSTWTEYVLFRRRLVPTRTGSLGADPVAFRLSVPARERDLFRSPFGRRETIVRIAPAIEIDVLPLPDEGRPEGFSGAVGRFSLDASLGDSRVVAGESLDLVVTVGGEGSLDTAEPPSVEAPPDVQVFAPREIDGGAEGRSWVFPLVPRTSGQVSVEGVRFSYFDSREATYRELARGPFEIVVDPAPGSLAGNGPSPARAPAQIRVEGSDLRFLKRRPSGLSRGHGALDSPGTVTTLAALPVAIVVVFGIFVRFRERTEASPDVARRRALKRVRRGLARAKGSMARDPDEAARGLVATLFEWAETMTGRPAKSLQRGELQRLIAEATGSPPAAERFVDLLDRAEAVRYAGSAAGEGLERLGDEIAELVAIDGASR